jgi:hypothetical protein
MLLARRAPPNRRYEFYARVEQAFPQNALPDHACRSKQN